MIIVDTPVIINISKKPNAPSPVFDIHYTVIKIDECNNKTFSCKNNYCIWQDLICDGHNNCGDESDEIKGTNNDECPSAVSLSWDMRSILILLAVILIPISMLALCIIIGCLSSKD